MIIKQSVEVQGKNPLSKKGGRKGSDAELAEYGSHRGRACPRLLQFWVFASASCTWFVFCHGFPRPPLGSVIHQETHRMQHMSFTTVGYRSWSARCKIWRKPDTSSPDSSPVELHRKCSDPLAVTCEDTHEILTTSLGYQGFYEKASHVATLCSKYETQHSQKQSSCSTKSTLFILVV